MSSGEMPAVMSTQSTIGLSRTRYFWLQLAALSAATGTLVLAHLITQRMDDSVGGATSATVIMLLVVVSCSLAIVARSTYVIVTSGFSDAYRVFRSRHLLACAALLSLVGATLAGFTVVQGPFDKLFAHGQITGEDIVAVSLAIAAFICMLGAGVACCGAWDRLHEERNWHRSLHRHDHRQV